MDMRLRENIEQIIKTKQYILRDENVLNVNDAVVFTAYGHLSNCSWCQRSPVLVEKGNVMNDTYRLAGM